MKVNICLVGFRFHKFLAVIEVTDEELSKHKNQRVALVLNKLTSYMLANAKRDNVILDYLNNLGNATYVTGNNIQIDLLNNWRH